MLQNFAPNPHAHIVGYLLDSGQMSSGFLGRWPLDEKELSGCCAMRLREALVSQGMDVKLSKDRSFPVLALEDGHLGVIAVKPDDAEVPILAWGKWVDELAEDEEKSNTALFSDVLVLRVDRDGDTIVLLDVEYGKLWDFAGRWIEESPVVKGDNLMTRDSIAVPGSSPDYHNEYELLEAVKSALEQERGTLRAEEWHKAALMYAAPYARF